MQMAIDRPALVFVISLVAMWLSAWFGAFVLRRRRTLAPEVREDFSVVQAATLTLLGLIIGFSFSMAVGRYDQRKNYEEEEANAIGTAFVRADLLPGTQAAKVHTLLARYVDQRLLFYVTRDPQALAQVNAVTEQLQSDLWSAVRDAAAAQPTPVVALAVSSMNDVLNSQGYTQAAWLNRIPFAAWLLMGVIALSCNMLVGYGARVLTARAPLLFVLPLVVAISFTLIADIDSPRGGLIRVQPQNLTLLVPSLRGQ